MNREPDPSAAEAPRLSVASSAKSARGGAAHWSSRLRTMAGKGILVR